VSPRWVLYGPRARELNLVDIVALGLPVWLIPLCQIPAALLGLGCRPVSMRGCVRQTLMVDSLLELANAMSSWASDLPPDHFSMLSTAHGFVTSLVYLSARVTALVL
jgi:hypothetical protein